MHNSLEQYLQGTFRPLTTYHTRQCEVLRHTAWRLNPDFNVLDLTLEVKGLIKNLSKEAGTDGRLSAENQDQSADLFLHTVGVAYNYYILLYFGR